MSGAGLEMPHVTPHFGPDGLCLCPCGDCTTRLAKFCVCLECPCDDYEDHDGGLVKGVPAFVATLPLSPDAWKVPDGPR